MLWLDTLRALAAPARLVPLLSVVVLLLIEQGRWSRDRGAVPLGALLCVAFVAVAPAAWRWLAPTGSPNRPLGVALYGALGASTVGLVGRVLPDALGMGPTFMTEAGGLPVVAALFVVGGWGLGRDIDREKGLESALKRAAALEREAERAQLLAIKSHLDPHFLFNTLNAIAEWCRQDGEVAERATLALASMLRTILEGVKRPSWPLHEELALVEKLAELHAIRDPSQVRLSVRLEGNIAAIEVPPMLLLQVVENAIKHGPGKGHRGVIEVAVQAGAEGVAVAVTNPGEFQGERPGGQGLPTLRRRVELAYGGQARLSIEGRQGQTCCTLSLPRRPTP